MKRVIIESPFGADDWRGIIDNIDYARRAVADSLQRGEAPFASHLLYTQAGILDDCDHSSRLIGMTAGWYWLETAELVAVYKDLGITAGMRDGIALAKERGIEVVYRKLGES